MFPTPIEKTPFWVRFGYKISLPIALLIWLLPLIAVMMTSVRSLADITAGNYWGWPTEWAFIENYTQVFTATPMATYFLNSLIITLPTVAGTIAISTMAGFALAKYGFKGNILLFAMFIAGNFIPFQILMIPVRNLTISMGMYDTVWALILFHIAFQGRFLYVVYAQLYQSAAARIDRSVAGRGRERVSDFFQSRITANPPGDGGARGADFYIHLERLFLGADLGAKR